MRNYEDMSDFEINKLIAEWIGFGYFGFYKQEGGKVRCNRCGGEMVTLDYCNNWSDIGPIIEKYGITLEYDCDIEAESEWWNCIGFGDSGRVEWNYTSNPKRAAAICFLMMQESK